MHLFFLKKNSRSHRNTAEGAGGNGALVSEANVADGWHLAIHCWTDTEYVCGKPGRFSRVYCSVFTASILKHRDRYHFQLLFRVYSRSPVVVSGPFKIWHFSYWPRRSTLLNCLFFYWLFCLRLCLDHWKSGRKNHIRHCSTLYHFSFICGKYCPTMT